MSTSKFVEILDSSSSVPSSSSNVSLEDVLAETRERSASISDSSPSPVDSPASPTSPNPKTKLRRLTLNGKSFKR
ncbi:MAG: hypothetical protein M1820_008193 [Bogoriella megaspora]|nr:MAG: hypothetical protein M1820_008193 [Bogoriella megaspora]